MRYQFQILFLLFTRLWDGCIFCKFTFAPGITHLRFLYGGQTYMPLAYRAGLGVEADRGKLIYLIIKSREGGV